MKLTYENIWHQTYDSFPPEGEQVIVRNRNRYWLDKSIANDVGLQWESGYDLWEDTEWAYPINKEGEVMTKIDPIDRITTFESISELIFDRPDDDYFKGVDDALDVVMSIPNVERIGKWEYICSDDDGDSYLCSECCNMMTLDKHKDGIFKLTIDNMEYCPFCGSRNREKYDDKGRCD